VPGLFTLTARLEGRYSCPASRARKMTAWSKMAAWPQSRKWPLGSMVTGEKFCSEGRNVGRETIKQLGILAAWLEITRLEFPEDKFWKFWCDCPEVIQEYYTICVEGDFFNDFNIVQSGMDLLSTSDQCLVLKHRDRLLANRNFIGPLAYYQTKDPRPDDAEVGSWLLTTLLARLVEQASNADGDEVLKTANYVADSLASGEPWSRLAQMALRQLSNDLDTAVALVGGVLVGVLETCGCPQPEVRDAAVILCGAAAGSMIDRQGTGVHSLWGSARVLRTWEAVCVTVPRRRDKSRLPEAEETPGVLCGPPGLGLSVLMGEARPFVSPGLATGWPAVEKWDVDYLTGNGRGERVCAVEIGESFTATDFSHELMTFGNFLRLTQFGEGTAKASEDDSCSPFAAYLAQHHLFDQFPELLDDLRPVPCDGRLVTSEPPRAWIGGRGSITPPHCDPKDNILVQISGEKFCRLYPPGSVMHTFSEAGRTHVSRVPVQKLTRSEVEERFPGFPTQKGFEDVILRPGDALFIPRGWFHYVQSMSPSISVNMWLDPAYESI